MKVVWNKGKKTAFVVCVDCGKKSYHGGKTFNYVGGKKKWLRCQECFKKYQKTHNTFKKGHTPWNKGIKINKEEYPQMGHLKKHTKEAKKKISAIKQGIILEKWNGFTKPLNSRIRESREYIKWRKAIFKRDNYICQKCDKRGGKLQADHIKSFALYPALRFKITNGKTLCIDCHRKTNTWGGRTRWQIV